MAINVGLSKKVYPVYTRSRGMQILMSLIGCAGILMTGSDPEGNYSLTSLMLTSAFLRRV